MTKTITFNELRRIKDALPSGSMAKIANELGLQKETVKNYFGGTDYKEGQSVGLHSEPGPDGGIVQLDDTSILEVAQSMLDEQRNKYITPKEAVKFTASFLFTTFIYFNKKLQKFYNPFSDKYLSASIAAMQPVPAAVTAWR